MKANDLQRPGHTPDPALCPLCQQPNQCAMASDGQQSDPCWCVDESFPAVLLDQVPSAARNRACICPRCVAAANGRTSTGLPCQKRPA